MKKSNRYLGGGHPNSEEKLLGWDELLENSKKGISTTSIQKLAVELGVSEASLFALDIGFYAHSYCFPMKNFDGKVVGIRLRPFKDPHAKFCIDGSELGLFVPRGVTSANVQMVVEGESDLAAALTLGFAAIGLPGANNCHDEAVRFISRKANACPCICFDMDPTGESGVKMLGEALWRAGIPYRSLTPPEPYKDLRDWLNHGLTTQGLVKAIENQGIQYPQDYPQGFIMAPNAIIRKGLISSIGPRAFAVLACVSTFVGENGGCWPARELIAKLTGLSPRTVDRAKATLKNHGLLRWYRGGNGRANYYTVDWGPYRGAKQPRWVFPALSPARPTQAGQEKNEKIL